MLFRSTMTISADYVSYDTETGILSAKLTLKDTNGRQEQIIMPFKKDSNGNWLAQGDGLPADIYVRSRIEDHIRAGSNTPKGFLDKRRIEVRDYSDTITNVKFTDPNNSTFTATLLCDDFAITDDCAAKGYGQDQSAKIFIFEDTQLIKGI